ncbi:MAG: hypothetical protein ACP5OA_05960 [Candidatus Woesearchaeota archaeon]
MYKHILFEGLSYSGKTTQAQILASKLENELRDVKYHKSCPSDDKGRRALMNFLMPLDKIVPVVIEELFAYDFIKDQQDIQKRISNGTTIVQDRGLPSYLTFKNIHRHNIREGKFQKKIMSGEKLPAPDVIFYLHADKESRIERMIHRTGDGIISPYDHAELYANIGIALEEEMKKQMSSAPNVITIDTTHASIDEIAAQIERHVFK